MTTTTGSLRVKRETCTTYSLSKECQLSLVHAMATGPYPTRSDNRRMKRLWGRWGSEVHHREACTCASHQFRSDPGTFECAGSAGLRLTVVPFQFPDSRSRCRGGQGPVGQPIEKLIEPVDEDLGEVVEHKCGDHRHADILVTAHTRHCRTRHRHLLPPTAGHGHATESAPLTDELPVAAIGDVPRSPEHAFGGLDRDFSLNRAPPRTS